MRPIQSENKENEASASFNPASGNKRHANDLFSPSKRQKANFQETPFFFKDTNISSGVVGKKRAKSRNAAQEQSAKRQRANDAHTTHINSGEGSNILPKVDINNIQVLKARSEAARRRILSRERRVKLTSEKAFETLASTMQATSNTSNSSDKASVPRDQKQSRDEESVKVNKGEASDLQTKPHHAESTTSNSGEEKPDDLECRPSEFKFPKVPSHRRAENVSASSEHPVKINVYSSQSIRPEKESFQRPKPSQKGFPQENISSATATTKKLSPKPYSDHLTPRSRSARKAASDAKTRIHEQLTPQRKKKQNERMALEVEERVNRRLAERAKIDKAHKEQEDYKARIRQSVCARVNHRSMGKGPVMLIREFFKEAELPPRPSRSAVRKAFMKALAYYHPDRAQSRCKNLAQLVESEEIYKLLNTHKDTL